MVFFGQNLLHLFFLRSNFWFFFLTFFTQFLPVDYRSKIFIYSGVYALLGILLARQLVHQYHYAESGLNLLPINLFEILLFSLAVVVFLFSVVTAYILARRSKVPISFKKRFNFLIPAFVGWIILFLLLTQNLAELTVPVSLILYGLILFNLNRFVTSRLIYFASILVVLGLLAFFFKSAPWLFLILGFSVLPVGFGLIARRQRSPEGRSTAP
jgi:hypothetical protein